MSERVRALAILAAVQAVAAGCTVTSVPSHVEFYHLYSTYPSSWGRRLVVDPNGVVWFVTNAPNSTNATIARMTPDGKVTFEPLAFDFRDVINGLARSPDGSIWFTLGSLDRGKESRIARLWPSGAMTSVVIPRYPGAVAAARDGSVWFIQLPDEIGRMTPAGKLTVFRAPRSWPAPPRGHIGLTGLAQGPDGAMWATAPSINAIVRITADGRLSKFDIPTPRSGAGAMALGPDGDLWFTEGLANRIGRITPQGEITEFASPAIDDTPHDIVAGAENDLWFCEIGFVGRITTGGKIWVHGGPGGTCGGIATDAVGDVYMTLTRGQPYSFSGPELGAIATFTPADWLSQVER